MSALMQLLARTDTPGDARNDGIEGLRLIAAFGIVWFHMQAPGQPLAYAALAAFVILTADLSWDALDRATPAEFWRKRVRRILVPWVAWSGFYLVLSLARGAEFSDILPDWRAVLIGPEIHLWFLPFVFLASALTVAAHRALRARLPVWGLVAALTALAGAALLAHNTTLDPPFAQWSFALPAFALGLVMALSRKAQAVWVEAVFKGVLTLFGFVTGAMVGLLQLWLAWPVLAILWRSRVRATRLARAGRLSFGIYLIHPFFMLVLFKFAPDLDATAFGALIVFAMSVAAVALLQRVPGLRALV